MKIRFLYEAEECRLQDEIGYTIPYLKEYSEVYRKTWMAGHIFKDWHNLSKSSRKKFKEKYAKYQVFFDTSEFPIYKEEKNMELWNIQEVSKLSLADCQPAPAPVRTGIEYPIPPTVSNKKKEETMFDFDDDCGCVDTTRQDFAPEKRYYLRRVDAIKYEQRTKAHTLYKMDPVAGPTTANELIQRIKDGKFTIAEGKGDQKNSVYGMLLDWNASLSWRTEPADETGFAKAIAAIDAAAITATDLIVAGDAAAGLAAIQAFQTATF